MQNLSFRYTRWINWRKSSTGHLLQGRFKAILVDSDSSLLVEKCLAYESGCVTLSEVGRYVNRDVGSIRSAFRRLSERLQDRPEPADRTKTLKTLLGKQT